MQTLKITRLAMLLAIGVLLNYAEVMLLPTAFIAPGVKLGIANTVGLIVLYYFGPKEYMYLGFLRVLMVSLFTGFGFNFLIAMSGYGLASISVMIFYHLKTLSIFGLSLVGAVFHGIGQIGMVALLYQSIFMINYLPVLMTSGVIAGLIVALISREVLYRVKLTV
jgi:heptaprenyl diphosphate synthase